MGAVIFALHFAGLFDYPEYKTYDFRVRLFAESAVPSEDIILILLDQASIDWAQAERGWSWPWPRRAYAEFVDYMNLAGAGSVTFDVIFSEPSVYGPEDDAEFIRASADFGRVVQTVFFSSQTGNTFSWPQNTNAPLLEPEGFDPLPDAYRLAGDLPGEQIGAQFPIPGLRETAGAMGNITGIHDSDNTLRRGSLFYIFDGKAVPGLSAASILVRGGDRRIVYDRQKQVIRWEAYTIPVDGEGKSLLNFRGNLGRYIPYSAGEILQSAEAFKQGKPPLLPPEDFSGKYVFFGFYAPGLFDIFNTPISSVYPGVGMHITMLDNILKQDFIRESPLWTDILFIALPLILIILLTLFANRIPLAVGSALVVFILILGLNGGAYYALNLKMPLVAPLAGILAAFLASMIYNYATEGSQKRFIKSAFSQYLSPMVIEQIIADPSQLKLGGEKREMTAIFTDVRSFSTISEALGDPAKLVELLNFYLTRMSNIILENHGTIDKYEGDAIIAFFGAPVHMPDHAALACRSAVLMKRAEAEINKEALAQSLITRKVMEAMVHKKILKDVNDLNPLYTRLGINTGEMVVGNMGTPNKMDYTIMGNAVNLAARLEGVNKQYNTGGILISEYTQAKIGDEFLTRGLSRVRVVGVDTPLRLYEVLELREGAPQAMLDMLNNWNRAFSVYENQGFPEALNLFNAIYQENQQDRVAKLYLDRCKKYTTEPPAPEKWDNGVDNLTEK
ncbi:MAG: adenylate/guanylate cyclase domain-containing protein [Treponema sp.]|nr:adenylate/guanylate cyclase domain-containing protein [Treponema sp.]